MPTLCDRPATEHSDQRPGHEGQRLQMVLTGDGSPTLSDRSAHAGVIPATDPDHTQAKGEAMHHLNGAASESLHVYGPAIRMAWSMFAQSSIQETLRVAVVGLGLGYLERLCVALGPRSTESRPGLGSSAKTIAPLELHSFESNPTLVEAFTSWLQGGHCSWHQAAHDTLGRLLAEQATLATEPHVTGEDLLQRLRIMLQDKAWQWRGPLRDHLLSAGTESQNYHALLFDPYSAHALPQLWSYEFLTQWLSLVANESFCVFATFASRSSLHRALKQQGFKVTVRPGFGGKRECTLAIRVRLTCP
jgi:hypothetical protein